MQAALSLKSVRFQQFFLELTLQISSRRFLNCAPFSGHRLLLSLALLASARLQFARQMRNFRAVRPDLPFVGLRVGIQCGQVI